MEHKNITHVNSINMTTKEKFYKAINIIADKKDKDLICIKACEELSELQTKLLQYVNKKSVKDEDIAEEVANVLFNCEILRIVLNFLYLTAT